MSIIESLVHGGLSLYNMYSQAKALNPFQSKEDAKESSEAAIKVFALKSAEEYFAGRIDGKQAVADGINALLDYKISTALEDRGVNPLLAKGISLMASSWGASLAKGVEDHLFKNSDTLDTGERVLYANGRAPQANEGMLARLTSLLGGQDVGGPGAPGVGGGGRYREQATGV